MLYHHISYKLLGGKAQHLFSTSTEVAVKSFPKSTVLAHKM